MLTRVRAVTFALTCQPEGKRDSNSEARHAAEKLLRNDTLNMRNPRSVSGEDSVVGGCERGGLPDTLLEELWTGTTRESNVFISCFLAVVFSTRQKPHVCEGDW